MHISGLIWKTRLDFCFWSLSLVNKIVFMAIFGVIKSIFPILWASWIWWRRAEANRNSFPWLLIYSNMFCEFIYCCVVNKNCMHFLILYNYNFLAFVFDKYKLKQNAVGEKICCRLCKYNLAFFRNTVGEKQTKKMACT